MPDLSYPEAILFDLDDTIITGDVSTEELWKTLCYQHAVFIEGLSGDILFSSYSVNSLYALRCCFAIGGQANLFSANTLCFLAI